MRRAPLLALALLAAAGCTDDGDDADAGPDAGPTVPPWNPEYPGHASFETLTTSNGIAVATVRSRPASEGQAFNLVDRLGDHIYAAYDEDTPAKDFARSLYLGLRVDGQARWLLNAPAEVEYVAGTSVIHLEQAVDDLHVDSYVFAPFADPDGEETQSHLLVMLARVDNRGADVDLDGLAFFDLDLASHADNRRETVSWTTPSLVTEGNGADTFIIRNLTRAGAAATAGAPGTADSPLGRTRDGVAFDAAPFSSAPSGNLELGMAAPMAGGRLAAGEEAWFGVVLGYGHEEDVGVIGGRVEAYVAEREAEAILQNELDWWAAWHAAEVVPDNLHPYEARLWAQSTAILKMGQLREPGGGHGQILASLVPGNWRISWVRDMAYAIMGLSRAGHFAEARLALEFMLNAQMKRLGDRNFYDVNFIERDLGVTLSADYAISVTRYFGDGTEESDINAAGPNIEFDNWGLFLWALGVYVGQSGDATLLDEHWATISGRVANLLVELIEPETGLLHPDSSIWERHWNPFGGPEPETRKHYTYSNLCAIAGLHEAGQLAEIAGAPDRALAYRLASEQLEAAVLEHLVVTPAETGAPTVAGNLEEIGAEVRYMDQAVVEAINVGLLDDHPDIAQGTLTAFDRYLAIGDHSPGYFRNDDGTEYDKQEWVMIDLRTASALVAMGERDRAQQILDWVTDQARHNHYLIAELFGREDGDYNNNTPMCGFGPGAYIMALEAHARGR